MHIAVLFKAKKNFFRPFNFAMKISPVNVNNFSRYKPSYVKAQNTGTDTFVSNNKQCAKELNFKGVKPFEIISKPILSRFKTFDILDYKKLNKIELFILRKAAKVGEDELNMIKSVAPFMKKHFDDVYGSGKWEFYSIGRSLEHFAKAFSCMGVKAKVVPMSNVGGFLHSIDKLANQNGIEHYISYLKKIGLNPNKIKKQRKTFIISDFCCSGRTLETAKLLFRHKNFGLNSNKIKYVDFVEEFGKCYRGKSCAFFTPSNNLYSFLSSERFKPYTYSNPLPVNELGNINKALEYEQNFNAKLFNFRLIDEFLNKQ